MKNVLLFVIILTMLPACTAPSHPSSPEPVATEHPQAGMPNPASIYCEENGNRFEIHTSADGSQYGLCVLPDGSSCDEWAYYRGECGHAVQKSPTPAAAVNTSTGDPGSFMPPGAEETVIDWWGVIKSTEPSAQYDDYFERQDMGQILLFGIDSLDDAAKSQLMTLRDSGKVVHLYGTLLSNVPDYNGSQILVDHIDVEE